MLKSPKQLPNCLKRAETSLVLIVFRHWLRLPGLGNNNEKLGLPERLSAGIQFRFRGYLVLLLPGSSREFIIGHKELKELLLLYINL